MSDGYPFLRWGCKFLKLTSFGIPHRGSRRGCPLWVGRNEASLSPSSALPHDCHFVLFLGVACIPIIIFLLYCSFLTLFSRIHHVSYIFTACKKNRMFACCLLCKFFLMPCYVPVSYLFLIILNTLYTSGNLCACCVKPKNDFCFFCSPPFIQNCFISELM